MRAKPNWRAGALLAVTIALLSAPLAAQQPLPIDIGPVAPIPDPEPQGDAQETPYEPDEGGLIIDILAAVEPAGARVGRGGDGALELGEDEGAADLAGAVAAVVVEDDRVARGDARRIRCRGCRPGQAGDHLQSGDDFPIAGGPGPVRDRRHARTAI